MKFTIDYTNMLARQLGFKGNLHEFWLGMNFESENESSNQLSGPKSISAILTAKNPRTSIASNDNNLSGRITIKNLDENPRYYSQLLKIEEK
jgi:hypothetical protein